MTSYAMNPAGLTKIWDFTRLKGQDNYHDWSKNMKSALKYSGLWDIVEQGHELLPDDLPQEEFVMETGVDEQPPVKRVTKPGPSREEVKEYQNDLKKWKDLNNQASELIYTMCDNRPKEAIEDVEHAMSRWTKLESNYMDTGFVLRFTKLQELWSTTLISSSGSIEAYVANIRAKSKDLQRMGAAIDEWILVSLLLNNLDTKYKDFVHRQLTTLDDLPDFDKIVSLLHEEERLLKRDNRDSAMATALRKKSKDNSDSGRGGKSGGGRGGNSNTNTNAKISKNPASSNYKGDGEPPECPKCPPSKNGNKKKHWPFDCFSQHEDRIPERFRESYMKNKAKANAATGSGSGSSRPDDFTDNSSTHISAMAHLATCEDCVGDEEFWGCTFIKDTPELGATVMHQEEGSQPSPASPCPAANAQETIAIESSPQLFFNQNLYGETSEVDIASPCTTAIAQETQETVATESSPELLTSPDLCGETSGVDIYESTSPEPLIIDNVSDENSKRFLAYAATDVQTTHDWMIDSGCTNHMYYDEDDFTDYESHRAGIRIANGTTVWTKGRGTVEMEWLLPDGSSHIVLVKDVLHVPDLTCGLFSISQATRKGMGIFFHGESCDITLDNKTIGSAPKVNNTYILSVLEPSAKIAILIQQNMRALATSLMFNEEAVELWHRRMGHLNEADLKRLVNMSKGIMLTQKPRARPICEACAKAKSTRKVSRRVQHEVLEKLGKIHLDLGGPFNVPSINGAKYYMLLTDQATLRTWCYTYQHKDETYKLFRDWKTEVENQSGCKVKIVRLDNGTEFVNKDFKEHFKDSGIVWEPTVAYTPEQNGLSEVQNRIVMNGVRAMLFDSQLSRYLWSELLHTKVYQKNRSPTTRLKGITPHEAWTAEQPYLGHMRIIGCVAWVHIPKEKRKKLDERSKKCYLVGYEGTNIFRVWNPATKKVERASHVDFDETRLMTSTVSDTGYWLAEATGDDVTDVFGTGGDSTVHQNTFEPPDITSSPNITHINNILSTHQHQNTGDTGDVGVVDEDSGQILEEDPDEVPPDSPELHPDPSTDATYTSRPKRVPVPSQKVLLNEKWSDTKMWAQRAIAHIKCEETLKAERLYCRQATLTHEDPNHHDFDPDFDLNAAVHKIAELRAHQATEEVDDCEPLTYDEAMAGPYAKQWKEAMDKQMKSFATMGTWELVPRTKDMPVLSGKWVFKIKKKLDGSILYKARWVVRGFEQKYGVNYDQTFASVVKSMSFKVLFAIMAHFDLDCEQMDVVTAFLNALLKERIYVEQPKGYGGGKNSLVCRLLRALYGLKQSPREWYHTLRDFLISKGFKHTESDHSLFVNKSTRLIVSVYVDDIQIYGPKGSKHIKELKKELTKRFSMTDLGPSTYYLGMEIQRDRTKRTVRVTQTTYLRKVLDRFNMANCAPVPTPMVMGTQLEAEVIDKAKPDVVQEYQSMVGSIMYAMIQTRPDICFAVTILSRYNQNPNSKHIAAVKRVIRYLKGTLTHGITYGTDDGLLGYTDADWASDVETRRSLGAYIFLLYGGPISWSSKRQQSIALSSCEAEYMAQTQAAKEAIWLTRLLSELDIGLSLPGKPVLIKADNQGAIAIASDPRFHTRTKHIDIQWHFVRDQVETGAVEFSWIPTNFMAADGLTKALSNEKFAAFLRQIGLKESK